MARSGVVCDTVCTGDQVKALMEQCGTGNLLPRNFGGVRARLRGDVVTRYSLTLSLSLGSPCVPVGCYKSKDTFSCKNLKNQAMASINNSSQIQGVHFRYTPVSYDDLPPKLQSQ